MNKVNKIMSAIAKMENNAKEIELAKYEVNLAIVDDVKNMYDNANKLYKTNTDTLSKFANKMETDFQKTADEYKKALDKYNQLEKMSKELGINLPADIVKIKNLIEYGITDSLKSKQNAINIMSI